jgi:hypothetical protein
MYVSNWTFRPNPGKQAEAIENTRKIAEFGRNMAQTNVTYSI